MAVARQLADDPLGRRALAHTLHEGRLDPATELGLDSLAPHVVAVGPAMVADRADIDETDLQRLLRRQAGGQCGGQHGQRSAGHGEQATTHRVEPG